MGINRDRFARKKGDVWLDWLSEDGSDAVQQQKPVQQPKSPRFIRKPRPHVTDISAPTKQATQSVAHNSQPVVVHQPGNVPRSDYTLGYRRGGQVVPPQTETRKQSAISINIQLPKMPRISKVTMPPLATMRYWGVFTILVVISAVGARAGFGQLPIGQKSPKDVKGTSIVSEKPTFKPALPDTNKESIEQKHVYDPKRQLYTFEDELLKSKITISQQPLPEQFKTSPAALQNLAKSIGATVKLETAFGTAYIATSDNKSSQRVVATHRDILMFIETLKTYDDDTWKLYLDSLRS